MTARILRAFAIVSVAMLFSATGVSASGSAGGSISVDDLLRPVTASVDAHHPASVRSRTVEVDLHGLDLALRRSAGRVQMSLFDDVVVEGAAHRREVSGSATAWVGRLGDGTRPAEWFVLVRNGDALVANFWLADGRSFEIRPSADGPAVHVIHELAEDRFHGCGTCGEPPRKPMPMPELGVPMQGLGGGAGGGDDCVDDGSLIDVLIVYTPEARKAAGGTEGIEAIGMASIASTNEIFTNSEIQPRLRLVHQEEVPYAESGNGRIDLGRLRGGSMPVVQDLRDIYSADLVAMLISDDELICGVAYLLRSFDPGFEAFGYSVTVQWCAVAINTFAHELGHNMGCAHDIDNAATTGLFPYSYGWRWLTADDEIRRTVMSYAPGVRRPFFSNPNVLDEGVPTGVPQGSSFAEADNARTINLSAPLIAQFRASDCPLNCADYDWRAFGEGVDEAVKAMAVYADGLSLEPTLYAGGYFFEADGVTVNHIARWNGNSWIAVGPGFNGPVFALKVFDDGQGGGPQLYAAGDFTMSGKEPMNRIARWNGAFWSEVGGGFSSFVNAMTAFNDGSGGGPELYAAGNFFFAGDQPVNRIARWDGTSWHSLDGKGETGFNSAVRALAAIDAGKPGGPALFAGGFFTFVFPDQQIDRIAKWDGTKWSSLGAGVNFSVRALALLEHSTQQPPTLYVGGAFTEAGGVAASYVAAWEGGAWSALGTGLNNWVDAITVFDDGSGPSVFAGGLFDQAGGASARLLASWDGVAWSEVSGGLTDPDSSGGIVCSFFVRPPDLLGDPGSLLVGGVFVAAGEVPARNIVELLGCPDEILPCPADVNGDGVVDFQDVQLVFGAWGPCPVGLPCPADVNGDGVVDVQDVLMVFESFGPCP